MPVTTGLSGATIAPMNCLKLLGKRICPEVAFHNIVAVFKAAAAGVFFLKMFFLYFPYQFTESSAANMLLNRRVRYAFFLFFRNCFSIS